MKTILALLLTCLPILAQTTYPMLSTTTGRTVVGGVTNLSFLNSNSVFTGANTFSGAQTITNAASTISGNGNGLTNLAAGSLASGTLADARLSSNVPLKDAANTFSGTNTFPAASFYPANNISRRMLWRTNDIYLASLPVHADNLTNNGDFSLTTSVFNVLLPALLGSNSIVVMGYTTMRTNLNSSVGYIAVYAGTNTNWMSQINALPISSVGQYTANPQGVVVFQNNNSFTSQYQAPAVSGVLFNGGAPITIANTAAPWNIYGGFFTVTSYTNALIRSLWFEEIVIP